MGHVSPRCLQPGQGHDAAAVRLGHISGMPVSLVRRTGMIRRQEQRMMMEPHHKERGVLRPADMVAMGFLAALAILLVIFQDNVSSPAEHIIRTMILAGGYVLILALYSRVQNPATRALRHWYPVALFPLVYRGMSEILFLLVPRELDSFFMNLDNTLFGAQPCLWFERMIHPLLTEILQFSYMSYYYFPTMMGLWLYLKHRDRDYHDLLLAIVLTIYGSFVGFLLVPVVGPRFYLSHLFTVPLDGPFFAPLVAEFVDKTSLRGGAFPSAHAAVAVVTLFFALRYSRRLFYFALPFMSGLFVATIYGRYHYVGDILAGLILGMLSSLLAPRINALWMNRSGQRHRANGHERSTIGSPPGTG